MHNPFALAVWIIENNTPDACAPFSVLENKKFFLAITKGFTDLSAIYAEFSIIGKEASYSFYYPKVIFYRCSLVIIFIFCFHGGE